MKAVVKSIRISPKKLNLVAQMVRGKEAAQAMKILELTPKKGADILLKAIKSASANATNNFKQDASSLFIQEIMVSKAPTYKRWIPASRGRMSPILKRNSHLTIKIGIKDAAEPAAKKSVKETAAKESEKQPAAKKEVKKTVKKSPAAKKPASTSSKTVKA